MFVVVKRRCWIFENLKLWKKRFDMYTFTKWVSWNKKKSKLVFISKLRILHLMLYNFAHTQTHIWFTFLFFIQSIFSLNFGKRNMIKRMLMTNTTTTTTTDTATDCDHDNNNFKFIQSIENLALRTNLRIQSTDRVLSYSMSIFRFSNEWIKCFSFFATCYCSGWECVEQSFCSIY